ncbi:bifunctional serine/threonine-protein kinase/formylglycine-generating enzyme family protein [Okeania sp.]|uniref:bifunctional serine/threonine-protein kinase/formylglycine-generating enzyme family protein n=1 Tax=Okeania sp. TaxID=3100323 RepID=UPI002B4ADD05|nr:bifunctional serine/threonine-protein kinase/formylglycine-generating enzyme family protein [Okeania sp.]MEB3343144.1 bifunctional serine/threonine-protein kinase/formylglycine-generating enzyme family protein [Okeania sp.]
MQSGKILKQRYKIIHTLGSGGFGDTYLAEDLDLPGNPKCVVKHLKPKTTKKSDLPFPLRFIPWLNNIQSLNPAVLATAQKLFEREAKTLYTLGKDSEQIPKLFAHFQERTEFYLVQEYIKGHNISRELTPGKKLSQSDTIALLAGILSALTVAHQNNIIHRDIKPENLMRRKSDNKIILIDFGAVKEIHVLAKGKQPGTTTLAMVVGTPGYMPNEQKLGDPQLSSDIYAVGMVGIKALTGKNPKYLLRDSKTRNFIWRNEAQVSDELANILDRMVHEYFPQRYKNAIEVLEALNIQTPIPPPPPPPKITTPEVAPPEVITPEATTTSTQKVVVKPQPNKTNKTRRQILILGGLAGSTFVGAILVKGLSDKLSPTQTKPSPTSPPQPNFPIQIILGSLAGSGFAAAMLIKHLRNKPSPAKTKPSPISPPQPKFSIQTFTTVKVNKKGKIVSRSQGKAEVMTENLGNGVSLEMVNIPRGRFIMGSPETEAERFDDESPQHYVDVPEFFIGKYPVTQVQWKAVMGNNPSFFKGASRPVENVSWKEATKFCQKLSEITGRKYSLPSESQWEYPCRAGTTTPFYFGETITTELVNYDGNYPYADAPKGKYRQETTDVGIFPPNSFGLYDMHGNVWEWCQDVWHSNYNGAPTDGSAWEAGGDSNRRLLRSGCWDNHSRSCRSAWRDCVDADGYNDDWGFRVASPVSRS